MESPSYDAMCLDIALNIYTKLRMSVIIRDAFLPLAYVTLTLHLRHVVIMLPESSERSHSAACPNQNDGKGQVFWEMESWRTVEVKGHM